MKKILFTTSLSLLISFSIFSQEKETKKETLSDGWYKAYSNCITPNGFAAINLKTNFRNTIKVWVKSENNTIVHIGRSNSKELHNNLLNNARLFSAPFVTKRNGKIMAEFKIVPPASMGRNKSCQLEIIDDTSSTASTD